MSTLTTSIQHCIGVLVRAIRQDKEIEGVQIAKKRVKLSSFLNNITVYIENPKESNKKLLQLNNEFSKFVVFQIDL